MSYCTHGENVTRFVESNREIAREKDEMLEGDCVRECGILNISASRNPFSLRLGPIFKSITSTTIVSYRTYGENVTRCDESKKPELPDIDR